MACMQAVPELKDPRMMSRWRTAQRCGTSSPTSPHLCRDPCKLLVWQISIPRSARSCSRTTVFGSSSWSTVFLSYFFFGLDFNTGLSFYDSFAANKLLFARCRFLHGLGARTRLKDRIWVLWWGRTWSSRRRPKPSPQPKRSSVSGRGEDI